MGRKAGGVFINPKKFGGFTKPCAQESALYLNCLALSKNADEKCAHHQKALTACVDAQKGKKKPWGSINYHLARLSRGRNYAVFLSLTYIIINSYQNHELIPLLGNI